MSDVENPLADALSRLTGLQRATGLERPEPAALRDHQDLWALTYAAFGLLKAEPQTNIITPDALLTYLKPSVRGDKRSPAFKAAAAAQLERVRDILGRTRGAIYVTQGRHGQAFSLTPPTH